jgi:acetyl-CoA synthetase
LGKQEKWREAFLLGEWFNTGDMAYKDEDGYYYFVGRNDDVISSAGYRIGPFEVESCLMEHPAVAECAVIGKPDALRGEIVKAFVVLRAGYQPSDELSSELTQFVRARLSKHSYPREVEFLPELPKTSTGKIQRRNLRELEVARLKDQSL